MPPVLIPGAHWHPSTIDHPQRIATLGITEHWTAGRVAGDIEALDGPNVDCHAYVEKSGDLIQFLDLNSQGWHAFWHANHYCLGIEHEGSGEPWTKEQYKTSVEVNAWLCDRFGIPVRHVDPSGTDLNTFKGLFGHRDLSLGGIRVDSNDHTDSVPDWPGWNRFIDAISQSLKGAPDLTPKPPPHGATLRLYLAGKLYAGWDDAAGPIAWVARNGAKDKVCFITWNKSRWNGPDKVTGVCKSLYRRFLV